MNLNSPAVNFLNTLITIIFVLTTNDKLVAPALASSVRLSNLQLTNHDKHTTNKQLTSSVRVRKNNNENICPDEYKSCWCDYTNTNLNMNNNNKRIIKHAYNESGLKIILFRS